MPSSDSDALTYEYNRLLTKKLEVDTAISAQKRAIQLNASYQKRFSRYTTLMILLSIGLVAYLGIVALRKAFPGIPEWYTDVYIALVIVIITIYGLTILIEINTRSVLNYDELDLPPYSQPVEKTA
jgi:hypothetical protein